MASSSIRIKSCIYFEEDGVQDVDGQLAGIVRNLQPDASVDTKVDEITGSALHIQGPTQIAAGSLLSLAAIASDEIPIAAASLLLLKHSNTKRVYASLGTNIGEGIKIRDLFIATELESLKYNFQLEKKGDPNSPLDLNVKLPSSGGYQRVGLNKVFWAYAISEYCKHQQKRILKGEKPE